MGVPWQGAGMSAHVVGLRGAPIQGSAGVRALVVEGDAGEPGPVPVISLQPWEVERGVSDGHITPLPRTPWQPGTVALCAHASFLDPGHGDLALSWRGEVDLTQPWWVAPPWSASASVVPLDVAVTTLETWGEALLNETMARQLTDPEAARRHVYRALLCFRPGRPRRFFARCLQLTVDAAVDAMRGS